MNWDILGKKNVSQTRARAVSQVYTVDPFYWHPIRPTVYRARARLDSYWIPTAGCYLERACITLSDVAPLIHVMNQRPDKWPETIWRRPFD